MKVILTLLITTLTFSQFCLANKGKPAVIEKVRTGYETLLKKSATEQKLEDFLSGGKKANNATARAKMLEVAVPRIARKISVSESGLLKLMTDMPEITDFVFLVEAMSKDDPNQKMYSKLIEKLSENLQLDVSSDTNQTVLKLTKLLAKNDIESEILNFAKLVSDSPFSIDVALKLAAKEFAAKKGMTEEAWLKALKDCIV